MTTTILSKTLPINTHHPMIFLQPKDECFLSATWSPDLFIYDNQGEIIVYDEQTDADITIGSYAIKTIDIIWAKENECSLFEVLDSDPDTLEYCDLLDHDAFRFSKQLVNTLEKKFHCYIDQEINVDAILILDKLTIDPKYRGKGFGLFASDAIMRRYRLGTGFIVMFPYPLQYIDYASDTYPPSELAILERKWSKPTKPPTNLKGDSKKLQNYYAKLGFVLVKGTNLMVRPPYLST